jgi:hypothetical protein
MPRGVVLTNALYLIIGIMPAGLVEKRLKAEG